MPLWPRSGGWTLQDSDMLLVLQTSNILLNKDHTRAKVADVGLSRVLQSTLSLSMASCPMGTFAYCGECSNRRLSYGWWCWAVQPWSCTTPDQASPMIHVMLESPDCVLCLLCSS